MLTYGPDATWLIWLPLWRSCVPGGWECAASGRRTRLEGGAAGKTERYVRGMKPEEVLV